MPWRLLGQCDPFGSGGEYEQQQEGDGSVEEIAVEIAEAAPQRKEDDERRCHAPGRPAGCADRRGCRLPPRDPEAGGDEDQAERDGDLAHRRRRNDCRKRIHRKIAVCKIERECAERDQRQIGQNGRCSRGVQQRQRARSRQRGGKQRHNQHCARQGRASGAEDRRHEQRQGGENRDAGEQQQDQQQQQAKKRHRSSPVPAARRRLRPAPRTPGRPPAHAGTR